MYAKLGLFISIILLAQCTAQKKTNSAGDKQSNSSYTEMDTLTQNKKKITLNLPAKSNPQDYKIELIGGKVEAVDCNNYFINGKWTEDPDGSPSYVLESDGLMGGTLMGCMDTIKQNKFIQTPSQTIPYTSEAIHVYVPEGFEIRYNIWTKSGKPIQASLEKTPVKPYPIPRKDQSMYVIHLQKKEKEDNYKVDLLLGKKIMVDCNTYGISNEIKENTVQGWGYSFYEVDSFDRTYSTLMACDDETKKEEFVYIFPTKEVRYNSKLPIAIYLPKEGIAKYQLWEKINTELKP